VSVTEPRPFGKTPFRRMPYSALDVGTSRLTWAPGGQPTTLDAAAAAMLDCFEEPLTPEELSRDLHTALALEEDVARRAANSTAYALQMASLIVAEGLEPPEVFRFNYPPSGSM